MIGLGPGSELIHPFDRSGARRERPKQRLVKFVRGLAYIVAWYLVMSFYMLLLPGCASAPEAAFPVPEAWW